MLRRIWKTMKRFALMIITLVVLLIVAISVNIYLVSDNLFNN